MKEKDWLIFKESSEDMFRTFTVDKESVYGFQIQAGTVWNEGLNKNEIKDLEHRFGFEFPHDYSEMLKSFNGFQTLQISIDPEHEDPDEFERKCYQYPIDIERTTWLIDEVNQNIKYARECLSQKGFDSSLIEGFIPLYGHRVLVVLKDKTKSPVLSVWGSDIILYGVSLIDYWCKEFGLEY